MTDGAKRASLSTIRDEIRNVQKTVRAYGPGECDENARDAAIKFLDGLDIMVGSFCRRLTGDNETLDPCPKKP